MKCNHSCFIKYLGTELYFSYFTYSYFTLQYKVTHVDIGRNVAGHFAHNFFACLF